MAKISRKEIFSIPNLMGYFRILMIPVFSWMYLTASTREDVYRAAAVVFISSVTDLLDGWVARRFHMVTELGKFVDPLADKLTHGALALCLAFKYPLMWALAALLAVKEGYMAVMGLILLKRGKKLDGAMWFGKVCTALLFVGMLMDAIPAITIFMPVLMPIAIDIGVDPIHFGVIVVVNLMIGLLTPPVGALLYVECKIAKVDFASLTRAVLPYIVAFILCLMVITYVPTLSTFLPELVMGAS